MWLLNSTLNKFIITSISFCYQMLSYSELLVRLPPRYSHLQRPVGGEECCLQRKVCHGAGFILASNPALNRFPLIGIAICGAHIQWHPKYTEIIQVKIFIVKLSPSLAQFKTLGTKVLLICKLTCSNDRILHQLSGDWAQEFIWGFWTILLCLQGLDSP